MKSNLKTADLLVYLSYFTLLTCERKLTTYAACYCIISHAPVGSKCKKNISTCCCPDKICEFLPAAGRCNRHTKCAKHGLWSGQGDSQMERTGCWQSRDVPEPSSDQAESTWVSLKPLLGVQNTGHAAAEAPLSGVHLPTCTYPILTGKSSPKEKLPPNLERLPFRRMANTTPAQQL